MKKPVEDGIRLRRHCDRCHYLSEMSEFNFRPYFTLFFIPVIPLGKGESLLVCNRCEGVFYPQAEDYLVANSDYPNKNPTKSEGEEKAVVVCDFCGGRLRVPFRPDRRLMVTCPHCKKRFNVKLN
ncbi:MAG: zinc-ribbon domain-containing protein [Blastocatellia bacterium]|nr:zinc-ribbon domain-containing protein [Blastocatellia bacterium]